MHQPQPNRLHDELDALLDGRPVELTDELAPLVEAADALRLELSAHQLDPEVADRHLERVLGGSALVVPMPTPPRPNGWDLRRRVVAVALAAALVLVPATMASAAALPGQAMYPFKLAIEQLRLASVQWSPAREAGERTRVANERLNEVRDLYELRMYNQLPTAIRALNRAVLAAQVAVAEAREEGEAVSGLADELNRVVNAGVQVVTKVATAAATGSIVGLTGETAAEIQAAVQESPAVKPPPADPAAPPKGSGGTAAPPQPTSAPPPTQGPGPTTPPTQPTAPPTTNPPEPPSSQPPTTTTPPTTDEPPTTPTPPSTQPPDITATPGSIGFGVGGGEDKGGGGDKASHGNAPPTSAPPTTSP
jgi:outer membrane biosynthesis protein TonB